MTAAYRICRSIVHAAAHLWFDFKVFGKEHLVDGGAVLACNHVSFSDPPLCSLGFEHEIWFLGRSTLFRHKFAQWLLPQLNCLPIDRDNADISGLRGIIKVLRSGNRVVLFPEGTRSVDGSLRDPENGVGFIVSKAGVPVQPMRLFGSFEAFPRNSLFPRPHPIRLVIGPALHFSREELDGRDKEAYPRIARRIMDAIAALKVPDGE